MLHLCPELLDLLQIRALKLHSYGGLDSCESHVKAVLHWHGPGVRQAWKLELLVHLANELFVSHPRPPLFTRLEHHRRVVHIEGCIVGSTVGSSDRPEDGRDFWKRSKNPILLLQELRSLRDRNTRKCRGHIERRAFKQGRHKLTADSEHQGKRHHQECQIEQQRRLAVFQAESQNRQIKPLRNS